MPVTNHISPKQRVWIRIIKNQMRTWWIGDAHKPFMDKKLYHAGSTGPSDIQQAHTANRESNPDHKMKFKIVEKLLDG